MTKNQNLSKRFLNAKKSKKKLSEAKNYQKQRIKVAKIHENIMNRRTDFLNKLSTYIIKSHDIICMEDFNTKGLLHNHQLAKSITDVSWASFVNKLEYKAKWYGKELIKVDRQYPSSQLCSVCGHRDGKKTLAIREWTCLICHSYHDRDINASKNILAEGLRMRETA
ncbi:RNA-guided endonuclease TnpB family protein [Fusobacterium necrophorum]|nr:RNA-guided endonuclease TnpB family protein [Fusobacterium necrophorum]